MEIHLFFRDSKEVSTKRDSLLTIVHLLRTSFSQLSSGNSVKDRLITVTTSKYPRELTDNYDFGNLHKYIDFVSVPAYNYDSEGKSVKHPSRLHGISDMENMDSLVDLVLALGLPAEKLIMGAPAHGILYKLVNTSQTIPGSPAIAWNINEAIISHSKICAVRDNSNWTMIREKDLTAPYIYFKDKWIGFDDEISLKLKTKYSILRGLGGIALWSVNDDDPQGKCGYGPFPLLQAIKSVLVLPTDHINQPYSRLTFVKPNRDNFGMGTSFVDVVEKYGNVERIVEEDESSKDESNSLPCSESGYMRHPKDCSRFYRCVRYDDSSSDSSLVKFQYGCPQGLLFDDKYEICNWPSWSPPCNGSGEIMVVTKKTFSCPSYGYFQDPDNCEYFYYCSDFGKGHFQGYEFKCPFGLGFDEEKLLCNWKWLVRGCGTSEPDANSDGSANLDAILSNFPPSFLSSASESAEIHSRGEDLAASEDDDLLARSDDSDEIKYVNGATNGHGIPAEHRQFEPELPKSRRSFARALKEHVTEFVGNVGNKVKTLFGGSDVNADTYTQKPTDDTFYKSQGSGSYLAISGHKQSHYGVASPLASESSSIPVNRPQISNPNKIPTAAASETLPISKNGFIPIQPASSQFSPSYAEKQWANNLADSSKVVGHSGFSNVNNMQTSGSNNEYHYYSNPVDPSMEVPNFVKIVELPTSPSPLPSTTSSNIKFTTTKKPQVLIVPVPDSQPQPTNIDEFEKLASMYPNLFPQGLDFNRIITTKRPFGKPNSKDDVVYVVVDDKNKPIGGPIKPNGEGNQFYDESKISFDELLRNPELLSALATQQGFNYESLIGAGGLGQRISPSHPSGSQFAGNQLPGNWIKHEEVKPVNEIKFVPTVSQSKPKHNNRKPTVAPLTVTTAKPRSTTSTESSVNRRRTSTTTTTLPPVTQYEIKRTTKKPSKHSATRTTVSSTTTSTTTTTTTAAPTTISSTSTSTTTPPPTTNSPPSSTTVATPVTSPSSLSNGSLTTDDNFFLGAQSIPQALYESIQAVIAQHLSQSGVTTSTTTPSPTSSTGSTTVNYDGTTIDSLRVSNSPFSHQTLNNINSNNNNNNNQPPAYHSYYYQPPGSNETVVYGQGWPSYQPSWYQYAFPPSPIYPTGLNFTNPLGSPYYPLGSPYPVPMYPPHHMNYQPQPISGSSASGSAPSGSYFDLQYVTPSDVTASPIFKTSEYPVPSTLSPNLHDKYGLYDGYDYHVPNIHGGYEAPIGSFSTDYMRSSTSPTTSTTTTTTSTTTTTTTTTPAPQTTQKASTETATEYITERPFDILRNKGDAPQIQVYIVQGANGPQVKTKTVHPHPHPKPQHHHQKVNDSPNVKVYVIDESKEPGQSESIQDISKTDSPYGRPIGAEELDSVHEISDNNNYNYDNNNNNYYSFSYETKPRSTTPTYPSYQTSTVKPSAEDNGASSPSAGYNHYKDIEYEDDSSYSGDSYNTDNGHLPAAKVNSLQSLYNSNLYPGLRNFTDGSVPEAACTRPGLFQHPGDCNKFYECYWDKFINKFTLHLFECPVKLAFDSRIVGCSAPTDPTVCVQY
uniref:Chitinase n=1 Tax=Tetranychus urticae TaxID=32264 RepID=T1KVX2_TETUR